MHIIYIYLCIYIYIIYIYICSSYHHDCDRYSYTPSSSSLLDLSPCILGVDMGSYQMASFSKAQQEQYGVDARGQVVSWGRFTAATAASAPCAEPNEQQLGLDEKQAKRVLEDVRRP